LNEGESKKGEKRLRKVSSKNGKGVVGGVKGEPQVNRAGKGEAQDEKPSVKTSPWCQGTVFLVVFLVRARVARGLGSNHLEWSGYCRTQGGRKREKN